MNDQYDILYNQTISPEEQDKMNLDELSTYKFKESVRHCLKEELVDSVRLDEFFLKKDNKINFIHDNFFVPHFKNKLYLTSASKVSVY